MLHKSVAFFVLLALCTGCSGEGSPPAVKRSPARTLRIGLIPEQNIFRQLERYEPLAEYLRNKTGIGIQLVVLPRYGNIIDNFKSLNLDGAVLGSFTYTLAHARLGVVALARPEGVDGASTYHGILFVRKDSGIRSAREMRGKRFAFVDKATTAGYLLPLDYFRRNGVGDYRKYFRETWFAGTHEDAIYDVLDGRADAGAAKNTVFERLAAADGRISRELEVLARSPDVPENGLALRGEVPASVRRALGDALTGMHEDPAGREALQRFGARRFIATGEADYRPVLQYARGIPVDLSGDDGEGRRP